MEFKVGAGFRTNPLSTTPGGVTVILKVERSGSIQLLSYDNIKNPTAYIKKAMRGNSNVIDGWVKEDENE